MDLHAERLATDPCDRSDVAQEVVIEIAVKCGVDGVSHGSQQQRVPIGRRMHDGLGSDIAAGARAILHYELLAKSLGQPLSYKARQDVGRATSPKADDDANRPRRIGLRQGETRGRRQ